MKTLPDLPARVAATTIVDRNIVVSAGAGTGKTSLLVERVLNLVGTGFCELERLAAITFTEKAAAELRFRIAEGLEQLRAAAAGDRTSDPAEPSGRSYAWMTGEKGYERDAIARRALGALQQIDRARVMTIHAFCGELLRSFPVEGRVDPDFTVDTGEQAELLCRAHWERFVEQEFGPDGKRHELWTRVLDTFRLTDVAEAARTLSGWCYPAEVLDPRAARRGLHLLSEAAGRSLAEIEDLEQRATGITSGQEFWFAKLRDCLRAITADDRDALDGLLQDPTVLKELDKAKPKPGKKLAGVTTAEFLGVAERARQLVRLLPSLDDAACADLIETIAPFATSFREEYTRRGFISFDGLLALTRDLLRDHPGVRETLKGRFDKLLVDEFQDTDPLQYEIVLLLGEAPGTCASDPWEVELAPGRLFIVGDPKQSIYRFRGADYDAFRRAVDKIGDAEALRLSLQANFRSVPGIVDPVNALFDQETTTSWRSGATQPDYEPITAAVQATSEAPAVEVWTVDGDRDEAIDRRRRTEGQLIADEVERLHRDGVPYGKVSILFRTFASIPTYLRPLRERNIPFVVDGGKDFIKRPEIKQSLAVLRTLAQPADATALLAFLRSPAGGVPDTELALWAAGGRRWDWRHETGEGRGEACPRIEACFAVLRELAESTRNLPPDAAVRVIVERVQLLPLAAAAYEGAQRVANLHKLVAAAGNLTRDGHLSLEDLVEKIEEGGLADLEADSPLSDDDTDAVRITSIHKMKGLENDWVLLPDLARQRVSPRGWGLRFAVVRDDSGNAALAVQHGKQAVNTAWIRHHLSYLQHEESEETRVLYVALTRARNRLILISSPGTTNSTRWYDALAGWGYDVGAVPEGVTELASGAVRHRLIPPPEITSAVQAGPPAREHAAVAAYDEAVERLHGEARPPFRAPSSVGHEPTEAPAAARGAGREIGLATGRIVHSALEHWDGVDEPALRDSVKRLAEAEQGLDRTALDEEVRELLDGFLQGELGRSFATLDIVARELPLLLRDDDGTGWRGSIDLLYRDDGDLVVADYKTDREEDESMLQARYGGQLAVYARAVREALGLETAPRTELWLLRHGKRIVVAPDPSPKGGEPIKRAAGTKRNKPEQRSLF
jgi:ATP-dependent helicase/nuclease subunit A